jgi:antitoxin VapB
LSSITLEEVTLQTTKVFKNGNSQAVRLPRNFRVDVDEMWIHRDGGKIVLTPKQKSWAGLLKGIELMGEGVDLPKDPIDREEKRLFD